MNQRVSVLMPVHNEMSSVAEAVGSVLEQTHDDLELFVIDGASTDDTVAVVDALAAHDERVHVLHNPAVKIPAGLNVGLAAATGAFIARVDAHARVNADYLRTGVAHLLQDEGLAAVGGQRHTEAATPVGRSIGLALSSPFGVGDSINHYATRAQDTDHASFGVYRTEVARQVGGWDTSLLANEDVDFDFRILDAGYRILYDPAMEIHWLVRETLPDLAHQYRRYGRGKGAMVTKNGPAAVRPRHLAPPALLLNVLGAAGLAALGRRGWATAALVPYAGLLAFATVKTREPARDAGASLLAFPAALATMHLSWGLGFYEGTLGFAPALGSQRATG